MKDPRIVYDYMLAGNAVLTISDLIGNYWFTYKIKKVDDGVWCVFLDIGCGEFIYIGLIKEGEFRHTQASNVDEESMEFCLFDALVYNIKREWKIPDGMRVQHSGMCGRCGRRLTTPDSIEIGLGPVCRTR